MTRTRSNVPETLRREVLAAGVCVYCGDLHGPFEVEHVRPVSRGGGNGRGNLACACVSCNAQKGTMLLHEWISWRVTRAYLDCPCSFCVAARLESDGLTVR